MNAFERPRPGIDEEVRGVREKNLRKAIDSVLHRRATEEEVLKIRSEMLKALGVDFFPPMSQEEMQGEVSRALQRLEMSSDALVPPEDEYLPLQELYALMGEQRQRVFETTLQQELGGAMTGSDIRVAREVFEEDKDVQSAWSTMIGEEVQTYARNVAAEVRARRTEGERATELLAAK